MKRHRWPGDLGRGAILLAVGSAGALLGQALDLPAGVILGALLSSGIYRLAGGDAGPWRGRYGQTGRLLLATVIGAAFGPDVIAPLKAALLPMMLVTAVIIGAGLVLGWALARFTQLDITTALISTVPGGLPAMLAMAEERKADTTIAAAIHFSRLTTILLVVPALVPLLTSTNASATATVATVPPAEPLGLWRTGVVLALGALAGLLALRVGVPTGDMIGPILIIGGANLLGAGLGPLVLGLRQAAMLLIGTAVGTQMSRQSLQRLREVALPAMVVILVLIAVGLLLGQGLALVAPLDLTTALLSSVPGGASTMPAIAHDLGGDMRLVAALHLTRQWVIFILVPSLLGTMLRGQRGKRIATAKPACK